MSARCKGFERIRASAIDIGRLSRRIEWLLLLLVHDDGAELDDDLDRREVNTRIGLVAFELERC